MLVDQAPRYIARLLRDHVLSLHKCSLVYLMYMHSNNYYSVVHRFKYHESEANGRVHQAVHLVLLLLVLAVCNECSIQS